MARWKRIKSALQWGLFYGIITWLAATAITNKFSSAGVWGIILSRVLMGLIIGYFEFKLPWWLQGILAGIVVNGVFGALALIPGGIRQFLFGWVIGFWLMLISGAIIGFLTALSLWRRSDQAAHSV